jgi:isocitrate lyase
MARAGLKVIYLSGWQVAADANEAGQTYPDQSLYPADSVPSVVRRINRALQRADQIEHSEGKITRDWFVPVVADAEAGFGGPLNAFELMKAMIEAGAAGVHFEDQVASEKKCGHMGGKVLVATGSFVRTLVAARLAADVMGVPSALVARTDADSAKLIMSDVDPRDREFIVKGERTAEGFFRLNGGLDCAIARALAYAPYADLLWCETATLAGFHALNHAMFDLALGYRDRGMAAYTELQQREFADEARGYTATKHQHEVGTGYFDLVAQVVSGGTASTLALTESTEAAQF